MKSEFERENRYIVIKRSDLDKLYKDPTKYATTFGHALALIAPHLPKRQFLVIESDWPEYEPARQMIEARMTGAQASAQAARRQVALSASRKNRIYVAGPMTGLPEFNFPAFNTMAERLRAEGWHVENPADHGETEGAEWADYLRFDIESLATCEAIMLLPGWSKSKGANLEVHIAKQIGVTIMLSDGAEAPQATEAEQAAEPAKCEWTYSEHEFSWDTQCGQKWSFTDGGTPAENGMNFCHCCGKGMAFVEPEEGVE